MKLVVTELLKILVSVLELIYCEKKYTQQIFKKLCSFTKRNDAKNINHKAPSHKCKVFGV